MTDLISSVISFFLVFLSITPAGSVTMTVTQNSHFSIDRVMTLWGSLEVEDIQTLAAHNSSRLIEFKQSWSNGNLSDTDWQYYDMYLKRYLYNFDIHARNIDKKIKFQGAFLIQCWVTCTSSLDDIKDFAFRVALDGEDLVYLNLADSVWVAGNAPHSREVQKIMQDDLVTLKTVFIIMIQVCHTLARTYSTTGKEAYSRKIQPEVYISVKPEKSEVTCMVTGFYPKPINVSLWKATEIEDVMSTGTLPNGDGTYQITVLVFLHLPEEQSVYCRVEHSSFKEPLIVYLDNKHHILMELVAGITVAVIVCVIGLACFVKVYKNRRRYTSINGMTMNRLSLRRD